MTTSVQCLFVSSRRGALGVDSWAAAVMDNTGVRHTEGIDENPDGGTGGSTTTDETDNCGWDQRR